MVGQRTGVIVRQMQSLLNGGTVGGLSDAQLLERFLERRDEVSELAFAVLVERHGPMVLGVCRRIVRDPHDADDAFQATFLVLARRARSIHVEGSLGRWLFGVATRVATKARAYDHRRRLRECTGIERLDRAGPPAGPSELDRAELSALIARELAALPARFQAPVLLCDLEGTSCEEASRRLGWPVGTVKSRLSRGRARLRERLTRRGLTPANLSIATSLWRAAPPPNLVAATARGALALISGRLTTAGAVPASVANLTQGVLRTMITTRLKLAAAAMLAIATGSAALLGQASAQKPGVGGAGLAPSVGSSRANGPAASPDQVDLEMLERAWIDGLNRRDAAVVGRILADDFEGNDQAGEATTRAAYLARLAGAGSPGITLDELRVRLFGETGVVTTRFRSAGSSTPGRTTKVYVRRAGRWQCVASHAASFQDAPTCPAISRAGGREALGEWLTVQNRLGARLTPELQQNCLNCHTTHEGPRLPTEPKPVTAIPVRERSTVRMPFDGRVERVYVKVGQAVIEGDLLFEIFSPELAKAKVEYEIAHGEWTQARQLLAEKVTLGDEKRQDLARIVNDEAQARLSLKLARDRLLGYGLTEKEVEHVRDETSAQKARLTLRSPAIGTIHVLQAQPGNAYHQKDVLLGILPPEPGQTGSSGESAARP